MNGTNFLIDTNIVIHLTRKDIMIGDFAKKDDRLYISTITYMEALGFPFKNPNEETITTLLCDAFERLFVTEEIEKETILIRKSLKIKLPDAIIAATAITHNLTLVTLNNSDFNRINRLNLLVPALS